jgi:ubiquinone/menaquinone biosynthesis C-methylase UbiE
MDYDATDIPLAYDLGRDHGPEFRDLWMNVVASYIGGQPVKTILDLGCGTGRFTEALAARFDAEVVGLDPSEKMLDQARRKLRDHRVRYASGRGEAIPCEDKSIDLIFMSMIFHHFEDSTLVARECRRVLGNGANVFLRGGSRERISSYAYVEFFPGSRQILEQCLPSNAFMREVFERAGFEIVGNEIVTQEIAPNHAAYADKLAAGADSVLARLSADEFAAGIGAVRAHAKTVGNQPVCEPIDVLVFR